jgi:hypothetical protein
MTRCEGSILKQAAAAALIAMSASAHAIPISGQGTWETTLQARDINTDGVVDAWYDTAQDISWMADVNYAGTSMFHEQAQAFVAGIDLYGVTGWRLPTIDFSSGFERRGCSNFRSGTVSACDTSAIDPRDAEITHLINVALGGNSSYVDLGNPIYNSGPFRNLPVGPVSFLTGTLYTGPMLPSDLSFAYAYHRSYGTIRINEVTPFGIAWAVHDGDVGIAAPVPEPETYAMMLLGLAGVGAIARRRARTKA